MSRFGRATAVRRLEEGRYQAELDGGFGFDEALNGGYLMAPLLRAAVDVSSHAHPVATSANFLRVARPGPAEVWVESRKTGRTAAVFRVTLAQDDRPVVDATVTTGTLDPDATPAWSGERPPMPPIDACVAFDAGERDRGFADRVDTRFDPATMGWLDGRPTGRPESRAYFRLREDHEPDAFALALAVDALPPVVLNTGSSGWAPTVELTWQMRAVPAPGWLTLYGSGRLVNDGWFDEEVEVWDSAGRLVAQSRQLARTGRGDRKAPRD
ncbi:thioesterase family protein [Actinomadura alba]|uniref:Thioesterase family protein n=1 Tax=Actinomadura alba TaxID=406431 RepID=A0ABR7LMF4_9ACTN|nr:thioesterase family protein [Actinomadura alba]MBC6465941.1 thioesterase family protein [Actinomadura alba]